MFWLRIAAVLICVVVPVAPTRGDDYSKLTLVVSFKSPDELKAFTKLETDAWTIVQTKMAVPRRRDILQVHLTSKSPFKELGVRMHEVKGVENVVLAKKHRYSLAVQFTKALPTKKPSTHPLFRELNWLKIVPSKATGGRLYEVLVESDLEAKKLLSKIATSQGVEFAEMNRRYKGLSEEPDK